MTRYHSEASARILARRLKTARKMYWGATNYQNHYKRKPGDCGNTRCHICHFDKYYQRDNSKTYVPDLNFREQLRELS